MIQWNDWILPELLVKFKVLHVRWEEHAESSWHLQYKEYESFCIDEKCGDTVLEDEQLTGQKIEAQISLSVGEILPTTKKEKSMALNDGWLTFCGVYEDVIMYDIDGETYTEYKLNSIFPLEIGEVPEGAQIGDWITVTGGGSLLLPRPRDRYIRGVGSGPKVDLRPGSL